MVRNRAWRRHHISRLKSKRKTYRIALAKTEKVVGKFTAPLVLVLVIYVVIKEFITE